MLDRFILAPTTIAVLALTTSIFAEEKSAAVPLKKFRAEPAAKAAKKPGDVPWNKPEQWIGQAGPASVMSRSGAFCSMPSASVCFEATT